MSISTTTAPYGSVVFITDSIGGVAYTASGVLIAPDEVLTASHVVYRAGVGTAVNIQISPGYDQGSTPFGTINGASFQYNSINDANGLITNFASQLDFAVIHLASPVAAAGAMGLEAGFGGGSVNITGYPGGSYGVQAQSAQTVQVQPTLNILDSVSLGAGSSGGPLWVTSSGTAYVVGVVSSQDTYGYGYNVQLTSADIAEITRWVSADNPNDVIAQLSATAPSGPSSPGQNVPAEDATINQLYSLVLGRNADVGALSGWEAQLAGGLSATQMRVDLATSPEAIGDIRAAYQNELGRPADAGGLAYFDGALGTSLSLSDIRITLSQSPEAQATLNRLYQDVLGRVPDASGLAYFTGSLAGGGSLSGIRATLANSGEAASDITTLYQNELGRTADRGGLSYFASTLAGGGSLTGVTSFLANSSEAQGDIAGLYQSVLGRAPYSDEQTAATQSLANGGSLASWRSGLATSTEAQSDIRLVVEKYFNAQPSASDLNTDEQLLANGTSLAQFGSNEAAAASGGNVGVIMTVASLASLPVAAQGIADVVPLLQTDFGTTPSTAAINAATLQLNSGLSFADLSAQETILAQSPAVLTGANVTPGSGPAVIDYSHDTGFGHYIEAFNPGQDIIQFSTGQFANVAAVLAAEQVLSGTPPGYHFTNFQAAAGPFTLYVENATPFTLTAANFRFVATL